MEELTQLRQLLVAGNTIEAIVKRRIRDRAYRRTGGNE